MSFPQVFTAVRATQPDLATLLANLRALDATGVATQLSPSIFQVDKSTIWTGPQITAVQNVLNTSAAATPQLAAQTRIDLWPDDITALALALIDQLNIIRAALPVPLQAITPAAAIAAVRAKAGTL